MSFSYSQIRPIGGIIRQPPKNDDETFRAMKYQHPNELAFLNRNLQLLSNLRSSSEIGVVPVRFVSPSNTVSLVSGVLLIDIHEQSKAGLLLFDTYKQRSEDSNFTIKSIFNMLMAFGYEPYSFINALPAAWELYDLQNRDTNDNFDHIVSKNDGAIGLSRKNATFYLAKDMLPELPIELLEELKVIAKDHWDAMEKEQKTATIDPVTFAQEYSAEFVSSAPQGHVHYPLGQASPGIHPPQTDALDQLVKRVKNLESGFNNPRYAYQRPKTNMVNKKES